MIGERIREARLARRLSLAEVAEKLEVSIATLSRMENQKQPIDVETLITLSRVLKISPETLLDDGREHREESLAQRIAALDPQERTKLWREVAAARRRTKGSRKEVHQTAAQIEELLAQVDYLREQVTTVRNQMVRKRR